MFKETSEPMTVATINLRMRPVQDRRQSDILDAVRLTFIGKGFDGASMQDLARAAGMSVGNFYRYFDSKNAIIEALVTRDLAGVEEDFAAILRSDDPLGALRAILHRHISTDACNGNGSLWSEITAAAGRRPEIGAVLERIETMIRRYLTAVFAVVARVPEDEAARRYGGHAALLVLLVQASGMRPAATAIDGKLNEMILRTIDRTLDEIAEDTAKV